jgi:D-glycero-alpha-D-manno-heptose-7-phosphate kinase
VDALYEQARAAGAIGGKLAGAGGGGFLLLFVPPEQQRDTTETLKHLIRVPFAFESGGSQVIFHETGIDYQQVEKVRQSQRAVRRKSFADAA